ncbi:hypothetical protein [Corynebacterium auriscanis]|uniref:hypothetical protein n=1 Tax=Corynebacterium auriscanis TaxID=99807 RepID=UPI00155B0945
MSAFWAGGTNGDGIGVDDREIPCVGCTGDAHASNSPQLISELPVLSTVVRSVRTRVIPACLLGENEEE